MFGSGNLVDKVGAESNDGDQRGTLRCPHDAESDAHGAQLGCLEPHLEGCGLEVGDKLERRPLFAGCAQGESWLRERDRRGRREGGVGGNDGQLVRGSWGVVVCVTLAV